MRILFVSLALAAACLDGAAVLAQAPVSPERQLSELLRRDASLREQIGRIQLDALVAQVDRPVDRKARPDAQAVGAGALRRDLDLYAF